MATHDTFQQGEFECVLHPPPLGPLSLIDMLTSLSQR